MKALAWLVIWSSLFSLPAGADSLFRAAELSDSELGELRGRYVMPGRIIHFGVTMSTIWENGAGQTLGAVVNFQVDRQAQPSLYITELANDQSAPGGTPVGPGTGQVVGGAGLDSVQGISQSVRSAGDYNDGLNSLEVIVSRDGGDWTVPDGATAWDGDKRFQGAVGTAEVRRQGAGLQIRLDAGSQGLAQQGIGNGSLTQQANFTGDMNTVRNMSTLSVALKDLPLGQDFANCTLEQLRALRPVGF